MLLCLRHQIINLNGEEYYLWYNADVHNFSVGLYKIDDLLAGKLDPQILLGPVDENDLNAAYSYSVKK